ncbi:MAG: Hsp70 family protein [Deltaproteobacteria bacterium]|nr:Hsp70 family protein [Deltaproteobacteria bacterium]
MKQIAMGIDLGTSNSCVAIVEDGEPSVLANEWGELIHSSSVSFLKDGSVIVGNDAKKNIITSPNHTVFSAKRLIGRFFFSEECKKAQAIMPYAIVEGPNNSVRIAIRDQIYTLPEIAAMVLKELRAVVEAHVGQQVTKAVITVPAFFNDSQRQETKNAGRIAGLEVLRILNEPTAAALAYGFGQNINQRVVIYDLGGGTFDVSILQIGEDVFEVLATAGDTYLGGDDFDERIMNWLVQQFQEKYQIDVSGDRNALLKLNEAAERAKINLSEQDSVHVHVPMVHTGADGYSYDLEVDLTRPQFNQMVMDLVQRTFKVCDEAMQSARLTASDVDGVILVGGPTRLPIIRNSVRHYFQREPNIDVDPDLVVALGAAIQADALLDSSTSTFLLDVTPQTLRLGTVGGYTESIIEKNTAIPIDRTRTFVTASDNQEKVRIRVYQGESRMSDECQLLGEFEFGGLRQAKRGEVKVEVTFEIDTDGIVNVSARDTETGEQASTTITLSGGMNDDEIEAAASRNAATELAPGGES